MVPTSETPKGECYVTLPGIIEVFSEETTDIEHITSTTPSISTKFIQNGALYIQTDGKTYDVMGTQILK
jgi:hypothetical protein